MAFLTRTPQAIAHTGLLWAGKNTCEATMIGLPTGMPAASRPGAVKTRTAYNTSTAGAGRMVISGRMADVCAELDRLVALEAQHAWH